MMEPPKKRRFLFLHASEATQRRTYNKSLDSEVRRHLMVYIGRSRRKPSKIPRFDTLVWHINMSTTQSRTGEDGGSTSNRRAEDSEASTKDVVAPDAAPFTTMPILHALSVFEKEWGEDMFSAYGFALIMVTGKNAMAPTRSTSTNTFWFPFAFRKSMFLNHYQQLFALPDVVIPLCLRSAGELRSLALERSLETIQCVESTLASSDASTTTSDKVLDAVLAMICYNFTSLDFDQAMIHLKGLSILVAARGGTSALETDQELMLMISWVDITAALLLDTIPLFPLKRGLDNDIVVHPGIITLPAPLLSVVNDNKTHDTCFMGVVSCVSDLDALAALLRFEVATKGDSIWYGEEQMATITIPVSHRLLSQPRRSDPATSDDIISEALRLGATIWIIQVKRRCRSYPGTAEAHISALLKMLSRKSHTTEVWNTPDLRIVRLWLLILCHISGTNDEDLAASIELIASDVEELGLASWDEVMSSVRQMPWVDIFEAPCAKLGHRLWADYLVRMGSKTQSIP
ncbi:hypothetical protein GE09DRAFT_946050 [Coniochaeta sp. 2T2.1]|nr:hypothetical protein GE09DRAFT_946050 [Coniochaeta sp. 2T2.1]